VIAASYERIHRSNLLGMGILPLQFADGADADQVGLTGREALTIRGIAAGFTPRQRITVEARREDGTTLAFPAIVRLDGPVDVEYYRQGGVLQTVLRRLAAG
jgi:aconitate hydratase